MYHHRLSKTLYEAGDIEAGSASARQALDAANRIGAAFIVNLATSLLLFGDDVVGCVEPRNASSAASALRDMRDSGQDLDQWLVLGPLAYPIWRLGHQQLAAAIRQGFAATVFATTALPAAISQPDERAEFEDESIRSTVDISREDLFDAVLLILDGLAVEDEDQARALGEEP